VFACCMGLRLARFNAMLDSEKPKWQSNYFTGMPAPAGAITVLLPLYVEATGLIHARDYPIGIAVYTLAMAFLLVSTIPTFSGKLMGERIKREWVPPIFGGLALMVGLLITYPNATMTAVALGYLAIIPVSWRRYNDNLARDAAEAASRPAGTVVGPGLVLGGAGGAVLAPATETKH
jgi:CDP-diacylglycerol---serine O-phosphatidyltransferase